MNKVTQKGTLVTLNGYELDAAYEIDSFRIKVLVPVKFKPPLKKNIFGAALSVDLCLLK